MQRIRLADDQQQNLIVEVPLLLSSSQPTIKGATTLLVPAGKRLVGPSDEGIRKSDVVVVSTREMPHSCSERSFASQEGSQCRPFLCDWTE